jgi:FtsP/CotA-like multicopper oxidase with cupredoxin domain
VPTSVHLHGGTVPPDSDGHPEDLIAPGATKTYLSPGRNPASTLWYHDHAIHRTGPNVHVGLAGAFLVSDGGLPAAPVDTGTLVLSVAERYEVVIDFSRYPVGRSMGLRNRPDGDFGDEVDPARSVRTHSWDLGRCGGRWVINGKPWNPNRVAPPPVLDTIEIRRFVNGGGGWVHPIHPHLVEYRGRYAMHCHNMGHEDHDMMTQFEVVWGHVRRRRASPARATAPAARAPGRRARTRPGSCASRP